MLVVYEPEPNRKLTKKEIKMLKALKNRPIVFDEDLPKFTPEQLSKFRRVSESKKKA